MPPRLEKKGIEESFNLSMGASMTQIEVTLPILLHVFHVVSAHHPLLESYFFRLVTVLGVTDPLRLLMSLMIQPIVGMEFQSHYRGWYPKIQSLYSRHFPVYGAEKVREFLQKITTSMAAWKLLLFQAAVLRQRCPELLQRAGERVLDIDVTTIKSFASKKEGAEPGYNKKYKGRSCFQLSTSFMGKVFVDAKLFFGKTNPKSFFRKAIKRAMALGYCPRLVRADAAYLTLENLRFLWKLSLGYAIGAPASFSAVKQGKALFKTLARRKHYSIIPLAKGVSALDLGIVSLSPNLHTRLIILRKISRRKPRQTGKWKIHTSFYAIATNLDLSVPKLYAFYHQRACIESGVRELKDHYHVERLPVQHLKGNEFWIICKILAMTFVKLFQVEMLPKALQSLMRATLLRRIFQKGFRVDDSGKVHVLPQTAYTWHLRRLICKLEPMKVALSP